LGNGGKGVVIVRYLTADAPTPAKGGTVTTDGLYTIHTFNDTGVFVP
jgi:hypothetical protein